MQRRIFAIIYFFILIIISLSSCANHSIFSSTENSRHNQNANIVYSYQDRSGSYFLHLQSGISSDQKNYILKKSLVSSTDSKKILEQNILISTIGNVRKEKNILRPKISQFQIWFDGKKHFSEIKLDPATRNLIVKTMIDDKELPITTEAIQHPHAQYCFYSQIIDCMKINGFIASSLKKREGKSKLILIWDGYPFYQQSLSNLPNVLTAPAELEYAGINEQDGLHQFNLNVQGHVIIYHIDGTDGSFKKMFWIAQGLTIIPKKEIEDLKNE